MGSPLLDDPELEDLLDWLLDMQALQGVLHTYRQHHPEDLELRNVLSLSKRLRGHMVSRLADYRARAAVVEDETGRHWFKGRASRPASCQRCGGRPEADVHRKCFECGSAHHAGFQCPRHIMVMGLG